MTMDNATADVLAAAIVNSLPNMTPDQKSVSLESWKIVTRAFYSALKTDAVVTIPASAIVTTGSAATQTGPTGPVNLALT